MEWLPAARIARKKAWQVKRLRRDARLGQGKKVRHAAQASLKGSWSIQQPHSFPACTAARPWASLNTLRQWLFLRPLFLLVMMVNKWQGPRTDAGPGKSEPPGWESPLQCLVRLAIKIGRIRLQNIIIGLLCLLGRRLLMDHLFLYPGICIWIWASKHSATWHVSGYTPMRCMSRQEAGNIMMLPEAVVSVACRQFKTKNTLFSCVLACKCVRWGFNLQTCFTINHWHTKLLSIRLKLFISPKLVLGGLQFLPQTN